MTAKLTLFFALCAAQIIAGLFGIWCMAQVTGWPITLLLCVLVGVIQHYAVPRLLLEIATQASSAE